MSDFIDFIDAANNTPDLVDGFLKQNTKKELQDFFEQKGYDDISPNECERLAGIKKTLPPYKNYPSY
jgi:hypothetical protein